jgi:transcription elongation factor Elf1
MNCPKCGKETCVLVTKDAKKRVREHRGLIAWFFWIITFPIYGLWVVLFGRKQKYEKKQYWHCNYCGKDFPA